MGIYRTTLRIDFVPSIEGWYLQTKTRKDNEIALQD